MKLLARLLALFLIMPAVELALLIQVDKLIGFWPTIGLIFVTGVVGGFLAKREGLAVWQTFNRRLSRGEIPGTELIDGVLILVAGALLVTPGVLTDFLGLMGLFPPTRHMLRGIITRRLEKAIQDGSFNSTMTFGTWSSNVYSNPYAEQSSWQGTPSEQPRTKDLPETKKDF